MLAPFDALDIRIGCRHGQCVPAFAAGNGDGGAVVDGNDVGRLEQVADILEGAGAGGVVYIDDVELGS